MAAVKRSAGFCSSKLKLQSVIAKSRTGYHDSCRNQEGKEKDFTRDNVTLIEIVSVPDVEQQIGTGVVRSQVQRGRRRRGGRAQVHLSHSVRYAVK